MKQINRILFLFAGICLVIACSKADSFLGSDETQVNLKKGGMDQKTVTVPFKSHFTVWDHSDYSDPGCGGFPLLVLTMDGEGTATHLGFFTSHWTFCCDVITGYYYNTIAVFTAANGDELYISIPEGYIVPNEEDNSDFYETKFNDPMYFVGGTGRFEGASGNGMTNAYVHNNPDDWHTDFFSSGTLTLIKGK